MADVQTKFNAALDVIQSLPKEGPYRPAPSMLLTFYAYYKQATEGPCTKAKPWSFDVINKAKWDAWNKLGNMSKQEAMDNYVVELTKVMQQTPALSDDKIIEVLPANDQSAKFVQTLGNFYEVVQIKNPELENLKKVTGENDDQFQSNKPIKSNGHGPPQTSNDKETFEVKFTQHKQGVSLEEAEIKSESDEEFCDTTAECMLASKDDSMSQSDVSTLSSDSAEDSLARGNVTAVEKLLQIGSGNSPVDGGEKGSRGEDRQLLSSESKSPRRNQRRTKKCATPVREKQMQGSGSGGSENPKQPQSDKHREVEERIAVVLLQLQRDMHSVLNRLGTLETIIITKHQDSQHCQHCFLHGPERKVLRFSALWWPFPEIHPKTALFFLIWPFIAKFLTTLCSKYAQKRK